MLKKFFSRFRSQSKAEAIHEYLSNSQNLSDLERRQRFVERNPNMWK